MKKIFSYKIVAGANSRVDRTLREADDLPKSSGLVGAGSYSSASFKPFSSPIRSISDALSILGFQNIPELGSALYQYIMENDGFFTIGMLLEAFIDTSVSVEHSEKISVLSVLHTNTERFESVVFGLLEQKQTELVNEYVLPWVTSTLKYESESERQMLYQYFKICFDLYSGETIDKTSFADLKTRMTISGYTLPDPKIDRLLADLVSKNIFCNTKSFWVSGKTEVIVNYFFRLTENHRSSEFVYELMQDLISSLGNKGFLTKPNTHKAVRHG